MYYKLKFHVNQSYYLIHHNGTELSSNSGLSLDGTPRKKIKK